MSEKDQFWQYAREAMLSVGYANTNEDKKDLIELARIWTQAALEAMVQERPMRHAATSEMSPLSGA